jgi:anti-sigma factor RsiW
MNDHRFEDLGAYALGALPPESAHSLQEHLAECEDCRAELAYLAGIRERLRAVPPEAFIDGPPASDDVLERTLLSMRGQAAPAPALSAPAPSAPAPSGARKPTQRSLALTAAVAALAVGLGAGAVVGRNTGPGTSASVAVGPNARTLSALDPGTGAKLTAALTPAAGWVRVHATVTGVPAGTKCQLQVEGRDGTSLLAASWVVSAVGEKQGTVLDGSVLVPAADVAKVSVVTFSGQQLVTATA